MIAPTAVAAPEAATSRAASTAVSLGCPTPGNMPGLGNGAMAYNDSNLNVFAGGSLRMANSAAELEGLVVAMNDFTVDRNGTALVNIGRVGVGSQITPLPGSTMLVVGGTLDSTDDKIDVAAGLGWANGFTQAGAQGGDVEVDGAVSNAASIELNGGELHAQQGGAARAPFAGFGNALKAASAQLGAKPSNGASDASTGIDTYTSASADPLQVFSVAASQMSGDIRFEQIPTGASVLVNVVGNAASFTPSNVTLNGVRIDWAQPLGDGASRILWNFVDATSVTIGGASQFPGSVLVPETSASVTVSASTNGRMYVGGDLTVNGSGNELHAYPWFAHALTTCLDTVPDHSGGSGGNPSVPGTGTGGGNTGGGNNGGTGGGNGGGNGGNGGTGGTGGNGAGTGNGSGTGSGNGAGNGGGTTPGTGGGSGTGNSGTPGPATGSGEGSTAGGNAGNGNGAGSSGSSATGAGSSNAAGGATGAAASEAHDLAQTGVDGVAVMLGFGSLALMLGGALLLVRRRMRVAR